MADCLTKMVNDHPLLNYIEDPFIKDDTVGYQKLIANLKDKDVKVAVKSWFGSDLDLIKDHTLLVFDDVDSADEDDNESQENEESKIIEASAEKEKEKKEVEVKDAKKAVNKKDLSTIEKSMEDINASIEDPNSKKFLPGCVHFDRSKHSMPQPFVDLVNYN
jgi:hypothetical protein